MPTPAVCATTTRRGVVVRGHRAASGLCPDRRIPLGTIRPQLRFFRKVPGFGHRFKGRVRPGTLNVRFPGHIIGAGQPTWLLRAVRWTRVIPAENFLLSPCTLIHRHRGHPGFLYIPDPATKPRGPPQHGIVEVLCGRVPGIVYGAKVQLRYPAAALRLEIRPPRWRPVVPRSAL